MWLRFQARKQGSSCGSGCNGHYVRQYFVVFVPISLLKSARADDMESRYKTRAC